MIHSSGKLIWSVRCCLGYNVMLVVFDGFSDASWVPSVNKNDEFSFLPVGDVVLAV